MGSSFCPCAGSPLGSYGEDPHCTQWGPMHHASRGTSHRLPLGVAHMDRSSSSRRVAFSTMTSPPLPSHPLVPSLPTGNGEDDEEDDIAIAAIFGNAFMNPATLRSIHEEVTLSSFEETLAQEKATHTELPIQEPTPSCTSYVFGSGCPELSLGTRAQQRASIHSFSFSGVLS